MKDLTPPPADTGLPVRSTASFRTDAAMWRSYVTDLIYGAATSPASYAREIQRRRKPMTPEETGRALASGEAFGAELRAMFPDIEGILPLARAATGEDMPTRRDQRDRWTVTIARCAKWLPKNPDARQPVGSQTTEQREAQAEALAESLVP